MLKILSRASRLAQLQVAEVMDQLPDAVYSLETINSYGDNHLDVSLLSNTKADIFTDAIDAALLNGKGDIAIHSAKDLPYPLASGLEVIALTKCLDNSDSLVSRHNELLKELKSGAKVGTSSPARRDALLALRPDLQVVSIRGTIEQRIAQVDNGTVDALIVATCALKRLGIQARAVEVLPFPAHPLQGNLAVVARRGSPCLRALFYPVDCRKTFGKVWLVGAGPGDPELLTLKAQKLIKSADVIYYDDLIDSSIVESCQGEKVYVGKRNANHSKEQGEINELLYESALKGNRVVRLKGGDPFIFGRGGEEVDYLRQRFIPVEVVPGISSVQAAAASTQVPLTLRGVSDSLQLISGHSAKNAGSNLKPTVAVYMGASNAAQVGDRLRTEGFTNSTPVTLVHNSSMASEHSSLTTVGDLGLCQKSSPLMMIVGDVGKDRQLPPRILYTGLDATTCMLDGNVVSYSLIRTEQIDFVRVNLEEYAGIIFTSKTAVRIFCSHYSLKKLSIYAIGKQTADEIVKCGYPVAGVAPEPDSDSFKKMLEQIPHGRLLYPCSAISHNALHQNPLIQPLPVYQTNPVSQPKVDLSGFSAIVFSSPSTVDSFFRIYETISDHCAIYVYGKFTRQKLLSCGVVAEVIMTIPLASVKGEE